MNSSKIIARPHAMTFLTTLLTSLVAVIVVFPGAASAAPGGWEHVEDFYSEVTEDTCDVSDLTVLLESTFVGRVRFTPRGPDRLPYYQEHSRTTNVYTNLATGESMTEVELRNENMLWRRDNGDGTLTSVHQNVHNIKMYDEDGNLIGHRTGRIHIQLVFEHAGTPTDPDDDEFVSIRIVKSASHGDDLCTALVPAIG